MRLIFLCFSMAISWSGLGQLKTLDLVSEGQRSFTLNPASAATLNRGEVYGAGNMQWWDGKGGPEAFYVGGAAKLGIGRANFGRTSHAIGLGGYYSAHKDGPLRVQRFAGLLNLQLALGTSYLSVGITPALQELKMTPYTWVPGQLDTAALPFVGARQYMATVDAGFQWYTNRFTFGGGANLFNEPHYSKLNLTLRTYFHFFGSYVVQLSRKLALKPVVSVEFYEQQTEVSTMVYARFKEGKIHLGAGYQNNRLALGIYGRFNNYYVGYFSGRGQLNGQKLVINELRLGFTVFDEDRLETSNNKGSLLF